MTSHNKAVFDKLIQQIDTGIDEMLKVAATEAKDYFMKCFDAQEGINGEDRSVGLVDTGWLKKKLSEVDKTFKNDGHHSGTMTLDTSDNPDKKTSDNYADPVNEKYHIFDESYGLDEAVKHKLIEREDLISKGYN